MDRHTRLRLAILVVIAVAGSFGCSRSAPPPVAAAPEGRAAAVAQTDESARAAAPSAQPDYPVQAPASAEPPPLVAAQPAAEPPAQPAAPAPTAAVPQADAQSDNPLRVPFPSAPRIPRINPLRVSGPDDKPPVPPDDAMPRPRDTAHEPSGGSAPTAIGPYDIAPHTGAPRAGGFEAPSASMSGGFGAAALPGSAAPGSAAPGSAAPGSAALGSAVPEVMAPGAAAPEVLAPGAPPQSFAVEVTADELGGGAAGAAPKASTTDNGYHVVQVFYGTDRAVSDPRAEGWSRAIARLLAGGCSLLVTLVVGLAAAARRSLWLWLGAVSGIGLTLGLSSQGATAALTAMRTAQQEGLRYSTARSANGHIDLGLCEVTIPPDHAPGELEAPSIWRLEIADNPDRFVALRKTERLADPAFYDLLRERVQQSAQKELFVFIHGFNVSFEDAARRTAQIHFDLKFQGAPLFFSWPAHDKFIVTYPADETNVAWSTPHLKQFLLDVARHSQAQSINLIAHSMGNRAVAAALREIDLELRDQGRLFNQVVLAAPDIDADDFRNNIAPAMQRTARRLTLYASSRDDALLVSQYVHRGPRAGDAGSGLVVIPGIDTIDVTAIDSSPWGHSYYGSSDPVLRDLQLLLSRAVPPQERTWLSPADRDGLTYWIFQPVRTAAEEATLSR